MRRIVITGASGNVGTALLRALHAAPDEYVIDGVARREPPRTGVFAPVRWHRLDLAEPDAERRLVRVFDGVDCVVHLAWGFQPTHAGGYLAAASVGGSTAVLRAADTAGVGHLLYMSSAGAYAPGAYGRRVDESWPIEGLATSTYSRSKAAVEEMLDVYERRHPDDMIVTRMRPGLVVQRAAATGLRRYAFPAYLSPRWLRFSPVLPVDRRLTVPVVHADDVAAACVAALARGTRGAFNLSAEPPLRRDDIAAAMKATPVHVPARLTRSVVNVGWRLRLQPVEPGWVDLAFTVPLLDTTRARTVLGWAPRWSTADAIADLGLGFRKPAPAADPVMSKGPAQAAPAELPDAPAPRYIP
ncbi:NAD-dependent epimerase/dehydratase family protein [Mycobacterium sp. MYCO198283]|uniref:NAD-dependent epimerase/dehydratase family protein n=1 Tax=Mycobacterium sp. MYCO198283 TaxID=2883505 RepID=UPI001E2D5521|nr:NAD-dependent epimerase/dehydratase family protein [Mycobacterium sp. MYCO198283]MCG5430861.1 NAD-dependent epimerase/dehydratase family protein [Mycobacterium sp. MYCO198283]